MNEMILKLIRQLKKHEGIRLKPYKDSVGKLTIGIGRNLDDVGITKNEAEFLLLNDISKVQTRLKKISWFNKLSENRKIVILNMTFNIGTSGLLKFKNMIKAIKQKDFKKASQEMLNSKWAVQVKSRAKELSKIMKTDIF